MPCGCVYLTNIEARERFNVGIHIFRVRPLQFARSTKVGNAKASTSGTSNSKVLTLFCISAKPESHMPQKNKL